MCETLREKFALTPINELVERHLTPKEQEAYDLFTLRGMGPRKIGRALGVSHAAIIYRLQSVLRKATMGPVEMITVTNGELEDLEEHGEVRAYL